MDRVRPDPRRSLRVAAGLLTVVVCLVLAACTTTPPPSPPGPGSIPGWRLTLPLEGDSGNAETVNPAVLSPPWLTREPAGGLTFWAPVDGATTRNSEHARTELSSLDEFEAGTAPRALTASVVVAQVPADSQDVIIGQLHGAGDIISVPFVMLHYTAGAIDVVVKQQQSGSESQNLRLLTGVPLGAPFDFRISDDGNGALTFTATYGGQTGTADAPLPEPFRGATVRFQAGAYQQGAEGGPAGDGARITFATLATTSGTAAPLP